MAETYIVVREFSYVGRWQRRGQEWVPRGHKWDAWYIARGYVKTVPTDEPDTDASKSLEGEQIPESEQVVLEDIDDKGSESEQVSEDKPPTGAEDKPKPKPKPKRKRGRPRKRQREE